MKSIPKRNQIMCLSFNYEKIYFPLKNPFLREFVRYSTHNFQLFSCNTSAWSYPKFIKLSKKPRSHPSHGKQKPCKFHVSRDFQPTMTLEATSFGQETFLLTRRVFHVQHLDEFGIKAAKSRMDSILFSDVIPVGMPNATL